MGKLLSEMILDIGKCPNQTMHESESAGALPQVQIHFKKQFSHKELTFGILVHMTALKSLRGRTCVARDITHLWPYPIIILFTLSIFAPSCVLSSKFFYMFKLFYYSGPTPSNLVKPWLH